MESFMAPGCRTIEWTGIIATLENQNRIRIQNILKDTIKELDFRDRVIKMSLSFQQLVVATASQCCIYSVTNWNTPHILDVKDSVILVKQCRRYFLLIDCFMGLQLFTYEGRHLSNPKFQGLRTESFNQRNVSLSNNVFAVIEHNDKKGTLLEILICFFDHIRRLMFKMRSEGRCYGICFFSYVM